MQPTMSGNPLRILLASFVVAFALTGCKVQASKSAIAFDGWWNDDYAKTACEFAAMNQKSGLTTKCIGEPKELVFDLETDFVSAFQENPSCKGITIYRGFRDPKTATAEVLNKYESADWSLSFNIGISTDSGEIDLASSQWEVNAIKSNRYARGTLKNLYDAASEVCRMVKDEGGSVRQ